MWRCLMLEILLSTGSCQIASRHIADELHNIVYNLPATFQDCNALPPVQSSNIRYTLYRVQDQETGIILTDENLDAVDPANRVIFIIHGWTQDGNFSWIIQMKNTYLAQGPANIIVPDWSVYGDKNYAVAFCSVPQVGRIIGDLIYSLTVAVQLSLNSVQINGISLGAQVAGYAGQEVQAKTNGKKIARINALDAAGPGYLGLPTDERLDASDADFVQALHTSNNMFGYTYPYGTVDFQINDILSWDIPIPIATSCGAWQPCCPIDPYSKDPNVLSSAIYCNHMRAVTYFTASITSTEFLGVPCTCEHFGLGLCRKFPTTIMGEHCPSTAKGELFLNPNGVPPYPKGRAGTGGVGGIGGLKCFLS